MLHLESPYNKKHKKVAVDAVVILSGGTNGKSANLTLSSNSFKRAIYGIMIAKKENLPIIFSGKGIEKYNEEMAMKESVTKLNYYFDLNLTVSSNIKKKRFSIFYEDKSLNTYQNAKFTKEIFKQNKIEKPIIYLVTSAFHMQRSKMIYEHFGFDVVPVATDFMSTKVSNLSYFIPSVIGFNMTYHALHEYAGILALKLRGI